MANATLFAYGTLQDADILAAVLGRQPSAGDFQPAYAPGFSAVYYPGRVYPALVSRETGMAQGLLLAGLSGHHLALLDAFEGDEYQRASIKVLVGGARVVAQAYFPTLAIAANAPDWSLNTWTQHHKAMVIGAERGLAAEIRARLRDN